MAFLSATFDGIARLELVLVVPLLAQSTRWAIVQQSGHRENGRIGGGLLCGAYPQRQDRAMNGLSGC